MNTNMNKNYNLHVLCLAKKNIFQQKAVQRTQANIQGLNYL